ncbi:MAG: hypothetical protein LC127_03515, partial [Chitinophagales bacterium]|nr:hypothetical protein [Chitinophagales bacterium]
LALNDSEIFTVEYFSRSLVFGGGFEVGFLSGHAVLLQRCSDDVRRFLASRLINAALLRRILDVPPISSKPFLLNIFFSLLIVRVKMYQAMNILNEGRTNER